MTLRKAKESTKRSLRFPRKTKEKLKDLENPKQKKSCEDPVKDFFGIMEKDKES